MPRPKIDKDKKDLLDFMAKQSMFNNGLIGRERLASVIEQNFPTESEQAKLARLEQAIALREQAEQDRKRREEASTINSPRGIRYDTYGAPQDSLGWFNASGGNTAPARPQPAAPPKPKEREMEIDTPQKRAIILDDD
jgi:hypothetical protein